MKNTVTKDEALRLALEALLQDRAWLESDAPEEIWTLNNDALFACREALALPATPPPECKTEEEKTAFAFGWWKALEANRAQPAGDHVKWRKFLERMEWSDWHYDWYGDGQAYCPDCGKQKEKGHDKDCELAALLSSDAQPSEWVGLSDEEKYAIYTNPRYTTPLAEIKSIVRTIEAKLREKNAGKTADGVCKCDICGNVLGTKVLTCETCDTVQPSNLVGLSDEEKFDRHWNSLDDWKDERSSESQTQDEKPVAQWNWSKGKFEWLVPYRAEWSNSPLNLYVGPSPSAVKRQVLAITIAYEQGVGKGYEAYTTTTEVENPYEPGDCAEAWSYGYTEGKTQAEQRDDKKKNVPEDGPVSILYKCEDCGHEQYVHGNRFGGELYLGSGADFCDVCDGLPKRVV